jgi:hypothetical protein
MKADHQDTCNPGLHSKLSSLAEAEAAWVQDSVRPRRSGNGGNANLAAEREQRIREAAYFKAKRRGFTSGHEIEDWLAARVRRRADERRRQGFLRPGVDAFAMATNRSTHSASSLTPYRLATRNSNRICTTKIASGPIQVLIGGKASASNKIITTATQTNRSPVRCSVQVPSCAANS